MKKIFVFIGILATLSSCQFFDSSSKESEGAEVEVFEGETPVVESPFIEGEWKGFAPNADSDEKGNTSHEIILTIKEHFCFDLKGLGEEIKDGTYIYQDEILSAGNFNFSYEDGKLYLLNADGEHIEMDDCYVLELAPKEKK